MKERGNEDNLNTVLMSTFSKTKNLNKKINKSYLFQKKTNNFHKRDLSIRRREGFHYLCIRKRRHFRLAMKNWQAWQWGSFHRDSEWWGTLKGQTSSAPLHSQGNQSTDLETWPRVLGLAQQTRECGALQLACLSREIPSHITAFVADLRGRTFRKWLGYEGTALSS